MVFLLGTRSVASPMSPYSESNIALLYLWLCENLSTNVNTAMIEREKAANSEANCAKCMRNHFMLVTREPVIGYTEI